MSYPATSSGRHLNETPLQKFILLPVSSGALYLSTIYYLLAVLQFLFVNHSFKYLAQFRT